MDEIGRLLALHPVQAVVHHAGDSGVEKFRTVARDYLSQEDHFVIANYLRKAIGREKEAGTFRRSPPTTPRRIAF